MRILAYFCFFLILFSGEISGLSAQRISRDVNVDLLINHAGYMPGAPKTVVAQIPNGGWFEVVDISTMEIVWKGKLLPSGGDFGIYSAGDFTDLKREGSYYIQCDTLRSFPFKISSSSYREAMELVVGYFSKQRCGASISGYLSPCHTDDGIRMDNGRHQDVSGGWHDASDLRKWVGATIYGMIGLAKAYELDSGTGNNRQKILDELYWGNRYFLKMQEPQGYIMSFVGGDVKKHSDSNRWTDNKTGPEGGELAFVKPSAGKSKTDMLIFGSNDDRVIQTDPLDLAGQYNFITAEALMAKITQYADPGYSQTCLLAAQKCFDWCLSKSYNRETGIIGASMQAAVELFKTTGDEKYKAFTIAQATLLKKLQVLQAGNETGGFFRESFDDDAPYKNIWQGCLGLISLCDMVSLFPDHQDYGTWKEIIHSYLNNYLFPLTERNCFGIVPFGLYTEKDPGGNRKTGKYWYRYFMQPELDWWVGINSNLASAGIGLIKAARIFESREMKKMAQQQLDWIIGNNPFNSSTLIGVGYNHPKHFPGSTFLPATPVIPGAVLNGLGGTSDDQPEIGNGNWQISEYWTPMVAFTIWLLAELTDAG